MSGDYAQWSSAKKVCVIGAGTMGSGIAAHLANIGFEVTLLDLTLEGVGAAFDRSRKARPPHYYLPETADTVRIGSIEDNLDWVSEADWVCEAIVEKPDAKHALFAKIEPLLRPDAMISTNTSGLEIGLLSADRSESFRRRFLGTHFFNPPRFLKLLELIPTSFSDPAAVEAMTSFLEDRVARRVVVAKDTPGFIANRFGMWSMFQAIHAAEKLRLSIEEVDAITGPFLGRPRSGSFRLNDIVGLDIMEDIARNLMERCPSDPHLATLQTPATMALLIEKGWIGDKAGHGYYRRDGKEMVSFDLVNHVFRDRSEPLLPSLTLLSKEPLGSRVAEALELKDEVGEYLRAYLVPTLQYADYLKKEISHSVQDFDRVMKWGFGWQMGPFEMLDAIGRSRFNVADGPFYSSGKVWAFDGSYSSGPSEEQYRSPLDFMVVKEAESFKVRDLGDGLTAVSLTTKMGTINPVLVRELTALVQNTGRLLLMSEAKSFSAGFDLSFFAGRIEVQDWAGIEQSLKELQELGVLLSGIPSVAAVHGHCLGAVLELAMNCQAIAAHPETSIGLPEARVGLLPGGGGTVMMRHRNQGSGAKGLADVAIQLMQGPISSNADESRRLGYLRASDVTVYHPDRLIHDASALLLDVAVGEKEPWIVPEGPLPGMIDRKQDELKSKGEITEHDELIGDQIKYVFTKSNSFEDALAREREAFVKLCEKSLTMARIKHMLETGKPLKN